MLRHLLPDYERRRDYVLGQAVATGKFGRDRLPFWAGQYDADPIGTERVLAALVSVGDDQPPYPPELFPELSRRRTHRRTEREPVAATAAPPTRPPAPVAEGADPLSREQVAAWSRQLFPDTAAEGAPYRRVTKAND